MQLPNIFESETMPLTFAPGEVIFSTGDQGDAMYVIKEGEVELLVGNQVVETVGAQGFFGEMALIEGGPRTATAVARTACSLIPINQRRFEFMVHEVPFFAINVMKMLSRRLRAVDAGRE